MSTEINNFITFISNHIQQGFLTDKESIYYCRGMSCTKCVLFEQSEYKYPPCETEGVISLKEFEQVEKDYPEFFV